MNHAIFSLGRYCLPVASKEAISQTGFDIHACIQNTINEFLRQVPVT